MTIENSEYKKINEKVLDFFDECKDQFVNQFGNFTLEEYLDHFSEKLDKKAVHFTYRYPFKTVEMFKELSTDLVSVYQPSDPKRGFLVALFQADKELHLVTEYKTDIRLEEPEIDGWITFISYNGIKEALDWVDAHKDLVKYDIYEEKTVGFSTTTLTP